MKEREKRELVTISQSVSFLKIQGPWDGPLTRQAATLSAELARLEGLAATQERADMMLASDGIEIRALSDRLREEHLLRIVRLGRIVLKWAPGAGKHLHVPPKRATAAEFVRAAEGLAKWLRPHVRVYRAEGFSADFLIAFKRATRDLKARARRSDRMLAARMAATAAIKRELPAARRRLSVIDALLLPHIRSRPGLGAAWRAMKRVPKRQGRPSKRRLENRRRREEGPPD